MKRKTEGNVDSSWQLRTCDSCGSLYDYTVGVKAADSEKLQIKESEFICLNCVLRRADLVGIGELTVHIARPIDSVKLELVTAAHVFVSKDKRRISTHYCAESLEDGFKSTPQYSLSIGLDDEFDKYGYVKIGGYYYDLDEINEIMDNVNADAKKNRKIRLGH